MMEEFVTFDIAKKLKENGFKERVVKYYGKHENIFDCHTPLDMNDADYRCSAPTIPQVLKWLRDEKKLYVSIDFFRFNGNTELWWVYTVRYIEDDSTEDIFESCKRKSWEQAALAGIEYVINNII